MNFDGFCQIASHFLEEDDSDAMEEELREAFRLYDKEGRYATYVASGIVKSKFYRVEGFINDPKQNVQLGEGRSYWI